MRVSIPGPLNRFMYIKCSVMSVLVAADGLKIRDNVRPLCPPTPASFKLDPFP